MANGDPFTGFGWIVAQESTHRSIQIELPRLHQLHHGGRGELFGVEAIRYTVRGVAGTLCSRFAYP